MKNSMQKKKSQCPNPVQNGSILEKIFSDYENESSSKKQICCAANSGRTIEVLSSRGNKADQLKLYAPDGRLELSVRLTDVGPILEIKSVTLKIDAMKDVDIRCDNFSVASKNKCNIKSEGSIIQQTKGDFCISSNSHTSIKSQSVFLKGKQGNVDISSSDVVEVKGRLIGLNRTV